MSIKNKILVRLFLEDGCEQENDEVSVSWQPINFAIHCGLFQGLIDDAVCEWLSDNNVGQQCVHEIIFSHCVEHDGGGALLGEYFEPVLHECQLP